MKRLICLSLLIIALHLQAATTVVWEGSKAFTSWSDVLNIAGSKFSKVQADDVVLFSITANAGAQLQVSYGSNWTNFEGLSALSVTGDYRMVVSSAMVSQLRQGIHVKGQNYTLTAISIVSNDEEYATLAEDLFSWNQLLVSGASRGEKTTLTLLPYGGAGWYWPEGIDLTSYASIDVQLQQPAQEALIVQLLYDVTNVKRAQISKGSSSCRLTLSTQHKSAYSLNFMSEKAQSVALASVNLTDQQGNPVATAINALTEDDAVILTEYYNAAGIRTNGIQSGINIIRMKTKGGRTIVRKVAK